jgi:hypothetical protein
MRSVVGGAVAPAGRFVPADADGGASAVVWRALAHRSAHVDLRRVG